MTRKSFGGSSSGVYTLCALCVVLAAGNARAADVAELDRNIKLDIPANTPLQDALLRWGAQTGMSMMFATNSAAEKKTDGVHGTLPANIALAQLLNGSGLSYETNDHTIIVVPALKGRAADAKPFRVADGDSSSQSNQQVSDTEAEAQFQSTAEPGRSAEDKETVEQVVITGTHIRGAAPAGSSLTTYTREDIAQTGVATLDQFARQMPQNFASVDSGSVNAVSAAGYGQSGDNSSYGAGFNLHGLGPGATLTLIDGHRLAPSGLGGEFIDISLIPLSAIDHIDVLADGASALYGADAIAGVVNVVLRKDFDGAESSVRYGSPTQGAGASEMTASQLFGASWTGGNAMLVYEYDDQRELRTDQRDFVPPQPIDFALLPRQLRNSVFATAHQHFGSGTDMSLDGYFSGRTFVGDTAGGGVLAHNDGGGKQYGANLEVAQKLGEWRATLDGEFSRADQPNDSVVPSYQEEVLSPVDTKLASVSLGADGPLPAIAGHEIRLAVGTEFRKEELESSSTVISSGMSDGTTAQDFSRNIWSAFGELLVPFIQRSDSLPGVQRLDLSVALRHDHYSDVGSTTNPKAGIAWVVDDNISFRASYARAFHAPQLVQLINEPLYAAVLVPNPASPTGETDTLYNQSPGNPGLRPERATSVTAGFDLTPVPVPGLHLNVTYFNITFRDRISSPPLLGFFDIFSEPAVAPFINLAPNPAQIQALFNSGHVYLDMAGLGAAGVQATFNNSLQNIAATREAGLDGALGYTMPLARGSLGFNTAAEYLIHNDYRATATSAPFELLNVLGSPLGLRLHGNVSWSIQGFSSVVNINHSRGYDNTLPTPSEPVVGWTTADLQLGYRIGKDKTTPWLKNASMVFTVQNIANKRPPGVYYPTPYLNLGYDPTSANPLGRVLSLQLTKGW